MSLETLPGKVQLTRTNLPWGLGQPSLEGGKVQRGPSGEGLRCFSGTLHN